MFERNVARSKRLVSTLMFHRKGWFFYVSQNNVSLDNSCKRITCTNIACCWIVLDLQSASRK